MKRFDLGQCPCTKYDPDVPSMRETPDGDYVLFADVEKEIERLCRVEKAARYYLTAVNAQYSDNLDCAESIEEAFKGLEKALEEK